MTYLSDKLKAIRISKGLTQKQLAEIIGVSQNAIYNWENGKREPKFDTLRCIADALSVPVGYFIESISIGLMTDDDINALNYFRAHPEDAARNENELKTDLFEILKN